ncbi:MAG: radical SAM protein [Methanosarcinales archaeon]
MLTKSKCKVCGESKYISQYLKVCLDCIRNNPEKSINYILEIHGKSRLQFDLPPEPPQDPKGVKCGWCVNDCKIPRNGKGYCGLKINENGKLIHLAGTAEKGLLEWYYDPLPTNCVADWICPCRGKYGYKNLAVFYGACTYNCLFCQNWQYRNLTTIQKPLITAQGLASKVDDKTSCICYFGGDPTPQLQHAIKTSEIAISEEKTNKILRICWESNGTMSMPFLKKIADLSMESGGIIKFDLKAFNDTLNIALCGITNKQTLKNFEWLAKFGKNRQNPHFLCASTLLVPYYVDVEEVKKISEFIADLDPTIPYSLLAFNPHFYMRDLQRTTFKHAQDCLYAAKAAGLENVKIGNINLLW